MVVPLTILTHNHGIILFLFFNFLDLEAFLIKYTPQFLHFLRQLNPANQIKTAFITPYGAYCYTTMPFGLKNGGATYQRFMQKCLHDQIGRNVHAYVDDIVVNSKENRTLFGDLKETFDNLRRFQMKLNPEKCMFGVPASHLLGFLVSARGIEANPKKIAAIDNM